LPAFRVSRGRKYAHGGVVQFANKIEHHSRQPNAGYRKRI